MLSLLSISSSRGREASVADAKKERRSGSGFLHVNTSRICNPLSPKPLTRPYRFVIRSHRRRRRSLECENVASGKGAFGLSLPREARSTMISQSRLNKVTRWRDPWMKYTVKSSSQSRACTGSKRIRNLHRGVGTEHEPRNLLAVVGASFCATGQANTGAWRSGNDASPITLHKPTS